MWKSRRPEKREIEGVAASQAIEVLEREGYVRRQSDSDGVFLERPGSRLSMAMKTTPIKAWVVEQGGNIELWLKYGIFVLLDTGDLSSEADRLATAIAGEGTGAS